MERVSDSVCVWERERETVKDLKAIDWPNVINCMCSCTPSLVCSYDHLLFRKHQWIYNRPRLYNFLFRMHYKITLTLKGLKQAMNSGPLHALNALKAACDSFSLVIIAIRQLIHVQNTVFDPINNSQHQQWNASAFTSMIPWWMCCSDLCVCAVFWRVYKMCLNVCCFAFVGRETTDSENGHTGQSMVP